MGARSVVITRENYREIHGYLEIQIERFLINSESWILALFQDIPSEPRANSLAKLQSWIERYLPDHVQRDLAIRFCSDDTDDDKGAHP